MENEMNGDPKEKTSEGFEEASKEAVMDTNEVTVEDKPKDLICQIVIVKSDDIKRLLRVFCVTWKLRFLSVGQFIT